jgi:putative DNA primase/helicase
MLRIEAHAKDIAKGLWSEIGKHSGEIVDDKTAVALMVQFARSSNSNRGVSNMVSLARSEPNVAIDIGELDTNAWLLNVENGTIDLQTGKLREHCKDDFITKLAPVVFDATATCPWWERFLDTIFNGNKELIEYVRRLAGYSMTGSTEEHILPFFHGVGANGKSTLIETLFKTFGSDYSMKAPPDLLMAKRGESHPTERADLHGKRLVACIETEEGRRMAEALVKELTGGDRIRARRMREDFWEFAPTHHVWLVGNHKPTITGSDHGIWRRIKLVPFNVVIAEAQQDKKLPAKLAMELPGILNWCIQGCLDWQHNGMREPTCVQAATNQYATESDDVGKFIAEHCEVGPGFEAPSTELWQAYRKAMDDDISQKMFAQRLIAKGFTNDRLTRGASKGRIGWKGLRLLTDALKEALPTADRQQP